MTAFDWYSGDKSGAYGTSYEVTLLSLAFVQYAESVVDGITIVKSLLTTIMERSQDYPGHDYLWRPPDSWRREDRDVLDKAKAILTDAISKTGQGKDLQLIQAAMASSCRLSMTTESIVHYRKRLVAGSKTTNKLLLPSHDPKGNQALRFPHLLPAVARMAMERWGELSGLLSKALDEVPAERLQGGPGGGSPTKAAVKAEKAALANELEAAQARAVSAEKRADTAEQTSARKVREVGCNGFSKCM